MNPIRSIAARLGRLAAACAMAALFVAPEAMAQGKVNLSNGSSCSYSSITVAPNGDLSVACASSTPQVPTCTISGPTSSSPGQSFTLTANCTNSPTGYAWSSTGGAPTPSGASGAVAISAAGTYTYNVVAGNAAGNGPVSAPLVITVQAVTAAPTCTFSATSPIQVGQSSTLVQTCTNSPTTYAWAIYGDNAASGPGISAQTSTNSQTVGPFNVAGTFNFAGQAGNALGGSNVSGLSIIVTSGTGTGGCAVPAGAVPPTEGYQDLGNLRFDLRPNQSGYKAFDYPLPGYAGIRLSSVGATRLETPLSTQAEVVVAPCPGQFTDVAEGCKMQLGSTGNNFYVGANTFSSCPLVSGAQYHVNIRYLTCVPTSGFSTCTHYIKVNGQ